MPFVSEQHYVISLNHSYLDNCPSTLVEQYAKKIIVTLKGWYIPQSTSDKKSYIFEHHVSDFHNAMMILSHICQNYICEDNDQHHWESHVYNDRFVVHHNTIHTLKRACLKFKQLLQKENVQVNGL